MTTHRWRRTSRASAEAGQALVFVLLALGLFLLGAVAISVDLSNLWFHRQTAQNAADAACTAGAMDLLVDSASGSTTQGGFTPGTGFTCSSGSTIAPCKYAANNGYNSANTSPGNQVSVSFPSPPPGVIAPPAALAANPFIRVDVLEHVETYFWALLSGRRTQDIRAMAGCGVVVVQSPIPILVLNPTVAGSLGGNGTPFIAIVGGPNQSIQVNSNSSTATAMGGTLDLSKGGPNLSGSNFGTFGGPSSPTGTFLPGTTGTWLQPSSPIADPFAQIVAPSQPSGALPATGSNVNGGTNGCPEIAPATCQLFGGGNYPSGIIVKNNTAIFDPGVYYVSNGLSVDSNSCVRPSTNAGDGSGGTIFYFADNNSISVSANTGGTHSCPATTFTTANAKCPINPAALPSNLPPNIPGSVLLAPCTGTYGDPIGVSDPNGVQRGILFFQNRSQTGTKKNPPPSPTYIGGGEFLLAGTMYFHQCVTTGSDTGVGCSQTAYNDVLNLQGNSGATTYILGDIISDQISMGGTPNITMDLSPTATYSTLKASLLQ